MDDFEKKENLNEDEALSDAVENSNNEDLSEELIRSSENEEAVKVFEETVRETVEVSENENASSDDAVEEYTTVICDDVSNAESPIVEENADVSMKKQSNKKTMFICIIAALCVALATTLGVLAWTLTKDKKPSSNFKTTQTAITVDDVKCSAGEFSFYYNFIYSYYYQYIAYGQISADDVKDMAVNEIAYSSAVYALAQKDGFNLTDEEIKTNITATIDSYRDYAEENKMSLDEFLAKSYGKGFNEKQLTEIITKNTVATFYKNKIDSDIKDAYYTDNGIKKVTEEYEKNRQKYDVLSIKYFYFANESTEDVTGEEAEKKTDEAKQKAEKLVSLVKGGQSFSSAIFKNFKDENYGYAEDECPGVDSCTYSVLEQLSEEGAKWAFEADSNGKYKRAVGDMKIVESNSTYYVLYVDSLPGRDESVQSSYRDILVSFGDKGVTDEIVKTAKAKAEEILKTFNDYVKENPDENAENYFALLAKSKSEDVNTAPNGGLVEGVTEGVDDISKWVVDSKRKSNDTAIIKDDRGFHIVFLTASAEHPVWFNTIVDSLAAAESEKKFENCTKAKDRVEIKDDVIASVIAFVENSMLEQSQASVEDETSAK